MDLIPGVQEGKRLTLDSVNSRVEALEKVVATIAKSIYTDDSMALTPSVGPEEFVAVTCNGDCKKPWLDQSQRIRDLESQVDTLLGELEGAKRDTRYWLDEYTAMERLSDEKHAELDELRGKIAGIL